MMLKYAALIILVSFMATVPFTAAGATEFGYGFKDGSIYRLVIDSQFETGMSGNLRSERVKVTSDVNVQVGSGGFRFEMICSRADIKDASQDVDLSRFNLLRRGDRYTVLTTLLGRVNRVIGGKQNMRPQFVISFPKKSFKVGHSWVERSKQNMAELGMLSTEMRYRLVKLEKRDGRRVGFFEGKGRIWNSERSFQSRLTEKFLYDLDERYFYKGRIDVVTEINFPDGRMEQNVTQDWTFEEVKVVSEEDGW